ncbi:hypothetical protein [Maritimibacter sp. 55A14]|uniref:hypothetical protein n=1 Tax=Maritimibacter sp. 55A14 TaxID=2174844 RepID=UPI001E64118A|nr:hypothetical protein [Maritimibacter sp. 55A14]
MFQKRAAAISLIGALVFSPTAALAYIGPGLGAGAIAAVLGVVGSIFLAVFAVLYYPIKRMLRKRRGEAKTEADEAAE